MFQQILIFGALLLGWIARPDYGQAQEFDALLKPHIKKDDNLLIIGPECAKRVGNSDFAVAAKTITFPLVNLPIDQWNITDFYYKTGRDESWWVLICKTHVEQKQFILQKLKENLLTITNEIGQNGDTLVHLTRLKGPIFDGNDVNREQVQIKLVPITKHGGAVTDIQSHPYYPGHIFVVGRSGTLRLCDIDGIKCNEIFRVKVETTGEMGLLGVAFHPEFEKNRRLFLRYDIKDHSGILKNRLSEIRFAQKEPIVDLRVREKIILEVEQKGNFHSGGQIAFGPDGYLYLALGEGRNEGPRKLDSLRGKILRINVDVDIGPEEDANPRYSVPKDNPFVGKPGAKAEIWAYGFRNPWRFTFDRHAQLLVSDVGENKFEEITIAKTGKDHGWDLMEGRHCYKNPESCAKESELIPPFLEYDRNDGRAIIGGYFYMNDHPKLKNMFIFGDGVTGRIWAISIQKNQVNQPKMLSLGRWPIFITTFGKDSSGKIYVGSVDGQVFRISADFK